MSTERITTNANVTIFILFFGISLLEAMGSRNWLLVLFWFVIGLIFLYGNRWGRRP